MKMKSCLSCKLFYEAEIRYLDSVIKFYKEKPWAAMHQFFSMGYFYYGINSKNEEYCQYVPGVKKKLIGSLVKTFKNNIKKKRK